ncbi:MAG: response regulator [Bacteroidales bacterium]|nr:response regulator [Bacteroidales bacterium]MCF8402491.1 response regulator [Bacteroidales bacterium]
MSRIFSIIAIIWSLFQVSAFSQQHVLINYSLEDGLPQASVSSIYQDADRNMWFGTQGGVCKYNGNTFVNMDTRNGLSGNHVHSIFQDSERRIWLGHRYKGLSLIIDKEIIAIPVSEKQISSIAEDKQGNIWVGTNGKGIFILPKNSNPSIENFIRLSARIENLHSNINDILVTREFEVLVASDKGISFITFDKDLEKFEIENINTDNSDLPFERIMALLQGKNQEIWMLGLNGIAKYLSLYEVESSKPIYFRFPPEMHSVYKHNMAIDNEGTLWGVYDYGLFRINDGKLQAGFEGPGYKSYPTEKVFADCEGNIWFGTTGRGVFKYPGDKFMLFDNESGLSNNFVLTIIEDNLGRKWFGTEAGICIYDNGKYSYLTKSNGLPDNSVDVIFQDSRDNIWIGYYTEGPLVRYNPKTKKFRYLTEEDGLSTTSVITINEDKNGNIWFGTLSNGISKYTYPQNGIAEKFTPYTLSDGISGTDIWIIHTDRTGNLWFGTDKSGLMKYDGNRFVTYNASDGLTNLCCGAITNDSENNLWIATIGGGVFKFDGEHFTNFTTSDGLSSDSPFSIICDNKDNVWVGTNSGIDKFEYGTSSFKHYGKDEGFLGIENNQNAILKDQEGIIWFGTMNGVVRFDPSKDTENKLPPNIVLKNIRLYYNDFDYKDFTKEFDPITHIPINMVFNYKQNHLTFEFDGITHIAPAKVAYQYKLKGFDEDWNPLTKSNIATYTNIPPGEYQFLVKSKNGDNYWNEHPLAFSFIIKPPIWQETWFRIAAVIFFAGLIYLIFWWRLKSIKDQKIKLQKLVDEKTIELKKEAEERKIAQVKAEQADTLKTAFLANMSHEIRTPVNAIVGFADLLKDKNLSDEDKNVYIEYITTGGKTLLNLINDIIDISKIESGQVNIAKEPCNVEVLFTELYYTFNEIIKKKGKSDIELRIANTDYNQLILNADPYRLKQILSNLIGNAIKFTMDGFIEFGYSIDNTSQVTFFVKDTGIGIPEDKQHVIFQRFRQVEESYTRNFEGTGLGLSISQKLTHLMKGKMWVESASGEGSTFYFTLPLDVAEESKKSLTPKDMNYDEVLNGKSILVVEDEDSNFLLIETMLSRDGLNITRAVNGNLAVDMFRNNGHHFDVVLMDIKIPGLNGYEATAEIKKIKANVPIIAQTAYAMSGEKEKCLEAGCDDYIAKPYNRKELLEILHKNLAPCHVFQ